MQCAISARVAPPAVAGDALRRKLGSVAFMLTGLPTSITLKAMEVQLTPDQEAFIRKAVASGRYPFPVGEYLILYRIMEPGVCIMHVVHARRDIEAFFGH